MDRLKYLLNWGPWFIITSISLIFLAIWDVDRFEKKLEERAKAKDHWSRKGY